MFFRSLTGLIFIFVAAVVATNYSESDSNTGYESDVIVHLLKNDDLDSSTVEPEQEARETAAVDLGDLLDAGEGSLVTLVAGDTRLAVHRAVLAARSPVFAALPRHHTAGVDGSVVRVPDMEGPVLRQLAVYLYTLRAPQLPSMAAQLLDAAHRFGLPGLKEQCERQVAAQLSVETAAAAAVLAVRNSHPILREAAVAYIRAHIFPVMATEGWMQAMRSQTEDLIQVIRLLTGLPAETSTPAPAVSAAAHTAATQPPTDHSDNSQPPTDHSDNSQPPTDHSDPSQPPTDHSDNSQPPTDHSDNSQPPTDHSDNSQPPTDHNDNRQPPTDHPSQPPTDHSYPSQTPTDHSDPSQTPDAAALAEDPCSTTTLDDADVAILRSLSGEEQGARLILAVRQGEMEVFRALLAAGVDLDARDVGGETALQWAAWNGRRDMVRCLIQRGADVNARNGWRNTPLHWAAWNDHLAVVQQLLAASADPAARNGDGWTPLHTAAYEGSRETAVALLEAGADRAARDNDGDTPLDLAKRNNRPDLVHLLASLE